MAKWNRFSARPQMSPQKFAIFSKKIVFGVDGANCPATLLTPPEAGLPSRKTEELVLAYFGTANWTQFCPGMTNGPLSRKPRGQEIIAGDQIGVFCGLKRA